MKRSDKNDFVQKLKDEIKNDEKCRWSLNCTMSRNEQVTYQKRKQDYKNYCNKDD